MFLDLSSDDDFVDENEGTPKTGQVEKPTKRLTVEDLKKQKQNERQAKSRAKKSEAQKQLQAKASAERMKKSRANQSSEKQQQVREQAAFGMAAFRDAQTPEQRQAAKIAAQQRMARLRLPSLTGVSMKDVLRCQELFNGSFTVAALEDSEDAIGTMSLECQYCGARKFPKETSTTCCNGGKVVLQPFPRPPEELMRLWTGEDTKSRIFREHSRMFNNAVCLSSLQVKLRTFHGFNPTIVFQGRVQHRAGSLLPLQGETPRFAQLYVYDPALESNQRFENMVIPTSVSTPQKEIIKDLLECIQQVLHKENPFVRDFKQIIGIPQDELTNGRIVISAKNTPVNEHPRRYNAQTNLQEVSILMEPGAHDLVIQRRGGGLQTISDLNPKGMPMHFTLLFPMGTYGWDPESRHADGVRRITTREFYTFHICIRDVENGNYLHMASRLFQEWLCMAWVHVEGQRLNYQRQNQKALRADTYKNVKEAVDERLRERELGPREDGLYNDDHHQPHIGRKILASSFTGSPRWYNAKFQDGMAICREYHKPDFFITMTCNPHWPEIQSLLLSGQTAQDRPALVAKVFKMKKDQLMKDLTHGGLLGKVVAHMHVIEFQK